MHFKPHYGYLLLFVPGLLAVILFPDIVEWLFASTELQLAGLPFAILMAGLYLTSPYHFLFYSPNQMGRPIVLTWIVAFSTLLNLLLNLLLIPLKGIEGAAKATVLSWFLAICLLGLWLNKNLS